MNKTVAKVPKNEILTDIILPFKTKSYFKLKNSLNHLTLSHLAAAWNNLTDFQQIIAFRLLRTSQALELFRELEKSQQWLLIETFHPGALGPVLEDVGSDKARKLFWTPSHNIFDQMIEAFRSC